jgi:hypothetical protein
MARIQQVSTFSQAEFPFFGITVFDDMNEDQSDLQKCAEDIKRRQVQTRTEILQPQLEITKAGAALRSGNGVVRVLFCRHTWSSL